MLVGVAVGEKDGVIVGEIVTADGDSVVGDPVFIVGIFVGVIEGENVGAEVGDMVGPEDSILI